jgi:uncharacterized membrane protein
MTTSLLGNFRARVFAGLLLIVPLLATLMVARWIFGVIDQDLVTPLATRLNLLNLVGGATGGIYATAIEYAFVLLLTAFLLYLLGLFSTSFVVRRGYAMGERVVLRIPLLKTIYSMTKQVLDMATSHEGGFKDVVLVEFPQKGSHVIGFLTGQSRLGDGDDARELVNVFLPAAVFPTSGLLLLVPRESVTRLDISVEEAIKMLVSGGALTPDRLRLAHERDAILPAAHAAPTPQRAAPTRQ